MVTPTQIGRYRIRDVLAGGDDGVVYRASDPILGRDVALFLFGDQPGRHLGERKLAKFTAHPGVIDIHDAGEHEGRPYHVLELVDGRSLSQMLRSGVRITTDAALSIAESMARALYFMHCHGVQHNDVRPANVMLRSTGEPVLVDFRRATEVVSSAAPLGGADIIGVANTLTSVLTGVVEGATLERLAAVAPAYVVDLVRRCHEGAYENADALARSLHGVVAALQHVDDPTQRFQPREGDTVLLHADNQEASLPGTYRAYHIEAHVSSGGFGDVYRAIDRASGNSVALKVLKRHLLADADAVARFRREADVLAYLNHPNIVRIYNYGRYGATVFIAMELIEGATLAAIRQQHAPMPIEHACGYVAPVLSALDVLSGAGIVHRDVKPTNVKVSNERVVLLDFGIAQVEGWEPLTEEAAFIGTIRYASPEQVRGARLTPASDVYAAGVMLYELLANRSPHEADAATAMMVRIATKVPLPVEHHRPDVPPHIAALVARMLAIEPEQRPTAAQAAQALGHPRRA